jgi:hypothetical protein
MTWRAWPGGVVEDCLVDVEDYGGLLLPELTGLLQGCAGLLVFQGSVERETRRLVSLLAQSPPFGRSLDPQGWE